MFLKFVNKSSYFEPYYGLIVNIEVFPRKIDVYENISSDEMCRDNSSCIILDIHFKLSKYDQNTKIVYNKTLTEGLEWQNNVGPRLLTYL